MATNRITLEAQPRTILSKGERNRIRKSGNIPGVIYGRGREPMAITVSGESFKQLRGHGKVLVDVRLAGGETVSAMVQDIAKAKINRETIHIDLNAVNLTEPINVDVQVILDGLEAVEKRRGVISQQTREVTVRCLPTAVPEYLLVNIANVEIGENVYAGDIQLPADVALITDTTEVICNIFEGKAASSEQQDADTTKEPAFIHGNEDTSQPRTT